MGKTAQAGDNLTPAPSTEDVAAAYREWRDSIEWHDNDYLAEKREFEAFKQGYTKALARARQDEGRDATWLDGEEWLSRVMAKINELTPDIKGKAFDPDWFLLRQELQIGADAIDAAMRRAEERGEEGRGA